MSYLGVQYSEQRQPQTAYPERLVRYLIGRAHLPVSETSRILDFGCGRGDFTRAWWRVTGGEVRGVDRDGSPDFRIDFHKGPVGLDIAEVDLVFSKSLIEHLPDPTRMLQLALGLLRPGGTLIIMCPDWRTYMKTFYDDYTHVRPYDQVSLKDLLEANEFANVSCSRIYQYPPIWRWPALAVVATLWRWLTPVEFSLWLSRKTGISFFRWASQLTLLAVATK